MRHDRLQPASFGALGVIRLGCLLHVLLSVELARRLSRRVEPWPVFSPALSHRCTYAWTWTVLCCGLLGSQLSCGRRC